MTTKWPIVVCPVRNSHLSWGTNNSDVHTCEPNDITVQSKNIAKKKFPCRNLRLWKYSWPLSCVCFAKYNHVQIGLASLSFAPLCEVQIPRRTAARAHFVAINNGDRQFYERLSRKFELVERPTLEQFVLLKFQKNFSAEFKTNISYRLLLQWFLWTFSGIY